MVSKLLRQPLKLGSPSSSAAPTVDLPFDISPGNPEREVKSYVISIPAQQE